jgi:hypothetical protein
MVIRGCIRTTSGAMAFRGVTDLFWFQAERITGLNPADRQRAVDSVECALITQLKPYANSKPGRGDPSQYTVVTAAIIEVVSSVMASGAPS